jgi:serine phosphatase RsbU (regulator of sigma subunit)
MFKRNVKNTDYRQIERALDLFEEEENISDHANHIRKNIKNFDGDLKDEYKDLAKKYKKLLKQTRKIVKLSDQLQNKLNLAYNELDKKDKIISKDLRMAQKIQESLLPKQFPSVKSCTFSSIYLPMDEVGGDFYDYIEIDDENIGIFLSDVSGHGVSAAFITSMIKTYITVDKKNILHPKKFILNLRDHMLPLLKEKHFTGFYGILNTREKTFTFCNAGHDDQIVLRKLSKTVEKIFVKGSIIGYFKFPDDLYHEKTIKLESGDKLVLFTDGLSEIFNNEKKIKSNQYGIDGICKCVLNNPDFTPDETVECLIDDVKSFQNKEKFNDDIALIVIEMH